MTLQATEADWRAQAACLGETELMMASTRRVEALELCLGCPVIGPCRDYAVSDREIRQLHRLCKVWFMVIGGLHPNELRRWLRRGAGPAGIQVIQCLHCGRRLGSRDPKQKMCSQSCRTARQVLQRNEWGRERNRQRARRSA